MFNFIPEKLGHLSDNDQTVWEGKHERPADSFLSHWLLDLSVKPFRNGKDPQLTVYKNTMHAVRWLENFIDVEYKDLMESFCTPEKYFQIKVLRSLDKSEINIVFKLRTLGLGGSTSYRIAARRVEQDLFACHE